MLGRGAGPFGPGFTQIEWATDSSEMRRWGWEGATALAVEGA
jgi:hypothetical protein